MKPKQVVLVLAVTGSALGVSAATSAPAAPAAASLESARSTVSKWLATQDLIFREGKAWQEERSLLTARIDALEREIAAAEARLADSRRILKGLRSKQAELAATEAELRACTRRLTDAVSELEADVRRLRERLPSLLEDRVEPLYRRIPQDPLATRVSAAERFQNVVGILNEVHEANGEIRLVTEIRPLSDGKPSEVKTVYIGLGQAYFLSARGEAGLGRPTAAGWEWQARSELAPNLSAVIEILESKGKPRFVPLPVELQ